MVHALHVQGNRIVDENNQPVQLRGMSLFWSQWSTPFYNANTISCLASTCKSTIVRAVMGAQQGTDGYLDGDSNRNQAINQVVTVANAAIANGMYVIIDWHAHDAVHHTNEAREFFISMANRYRNVPNVIFEIYNEPDGPQWPQVKAYAESVIGGIRSTGANNLVIVGTPTWSQDVDIASQSPITAYGNVAYTLHFYAATHGDEWRSKAQTALNNGIALFVTEWGTCEASGNGRIDIAETKKWINFMDSNQLSWCNWSLNDKDETASALKSGTGASRPTGPWGPGDLTESGRFVFGQISSGPTPRPSPGAFRTIALRSNANGKFVCAESAGNNPLIANRDHPSGWETFDLIDLNGGNVALRSHANGQHVCAENGGSGPLVANRNEISGWETFRRVDRGNDKVALIAVNGKYVCAGDFGNAELVADRDGADSWETFDLVSV